MPSKKSIKNRYERKKIEFDLCETEIARELNVSISNAEWKFLSYSKKLLYLEIARRAILIVEKYYELIPTYWNDKHD